MIGETVSLYQVLKMLGRGGMGRVFLAQDRSLDRKVALKFLLEDMESHVTVRQRFLKEARFAAAIDHPYVCKIYQVGEHEGKAFVAMEFVEGLTLREKLQQGLLAWSDTFRIAIQAAEALEEIHGRRLVHRDLKPSNIMLTKQGHVKIMDFGLAMEVLQSDALGSESETPQDLTSPGSMIGTVSYMSPEQARKQELDGRSDIFSFGIILYEMITGVHPFQKGTQFETASSILEEVPPPLTRYHSAIPELLQHTLSKMLAKEPERRYQSVHELRTNLSQLARTGPLEADTPSRTAVAVLPFVDMSPDGDQDYFCEGMAEELIGRLGRLEGLRVAARTSAFRFKAAELDIREIGRELNVGTVLEGSLRKSKDKLRIGVRLIDVAEGYPLWSERYDRDLGDVLEIQDEIARAVVEKLKVNFSLEDRTSARPTSKNIKAYERYLKGRYCWNNRTEASLKLSLEHFKKAIEQDPDYALAYAGMAASYATLSIYGAESPKELMPKAKSAAEKALRLDGRLALALTSLGCVRSMYEWDWEAGDQDFKQALEIEPRNEHAHHWYAAHCLMPLGRLEEACSHI